MLSVGYSNISFNPIALRKAKTVCSFGLSEYKRVNMEKDIFFICPVGFELTLVGWT